MDARTTAELERLLVEQGQTVALPLSSETIPPGKSHVFGMGILNIDATGGTEFSIKIELNKFADERNDVSQTEGIKEAAEKWLLFNQETLTIQENEQQAEPLLVKVPANAAKGTYIFSVKVLREPDNSNFQYGNTQFFTVTVE